MAFSLEMYPISYIAKYDYETKKWDEEWIEFDRVPYAELQKMSDEEKQKIYEKRNQLQLPSVSYTSQYGFGCFEGMKGFPTKSGSVCIFRPDKNAKRFANSMEGLMCPRFPEEMYLKACEEFIKRNAALGYIPEYDESWEEDNYASAKAVYFRPFMNTEGAVGLGIAQYPMVVICATTVSSYFKGGNSKAVTTKRIRATPGGTGWIKCAANYVISILAKKEAENAGYMEVVYLDSEEKKYIQEGSSCNMFFVLNDGTLVTPELGDTILPGITRDSVLTLAKQQGIKTEERLISIDEVMENAIECFVTGTAAGITPIESITHNGTERVFNDRKAGPIGEQIQRLLKGGQYGLVEDVNNWNYKVI